MLVEKYPRLIETVVEFKRYSRKLIADYEGKLTLILKLLKVRYTKRSQMLAQL